MRSRMPTGPNVLPPLSEFTVTSRGPRDHLKRIDLFDWMRNEGVEYQLDHFRQKVYVYSAPPKDCNPTLSRENIEDGWEIFWDFKP